MLEFFITFYIFIILKPRQVNSSQILTFYNFSCLTLINPFLVFILSINFLSFAGIPPLPGFITKFLIFFSLFEANYFKLLGFILLISLIAAYYYIRPIKIIVFQLNLRPKFLVKLPLFSSIIIVLSFFCHLFFLAYLGPILNLGINFEYLINSYD